MSLKANNAVEVADHVVVSLDHLQRNPSVVASQQDVLKIRTYLEIVDLSL